MGRRRARATTTTGVRRSRRGGGDEAHIHTDYMFVGAQSGFEDGPRPNATMMMLACKDDCNLAAGMVRTKTGENSIDLALRFIRHQQPEQRGNTIADQAPNESQRQRFENMATTKEQLIAGLANHERLKLEEARDYYSSISKRKERQ